VPIIQEIDAGLTDLARELRARGEAEGVVLGDWSFQVGTDGFDPLAPDEVTDVDYSLQTLSSPVGGTRYLGRVLDTGAAASVTVLTDGFMQVDGLAAIPANTYNRWLRVYGSADPLINGTWVISQYNSATSVTVYNPLATADDAGPLSWELREACVLRPNDKALSFHGRLLAPDATVDGQELGEAGVFGRVLLAPTEPGLVGSSVLFAVSHYPAYAKFAEMIANYHVAVQV
jgi:hypothetical protein